MSKFKVGDRVTFNEQWHDEIGDKYQCGVPRGLEGIVTDAESPDVYGVDWSHPTAHRSVNQVYLSGVSAFTSSTRQDQAERLIESISNLEASDEEEESPAVVTAGDLAGYHKVLFFLRFVDHIGTAVDDAEF